MPDVSTSFARDFVTNVNRQQVDDSWTVDGAFDRKKAGTATEADNEYVDDYYRYFQVVSDNEECFPVEDVADARQILKGY